MNNYKFRAEYDLAFPIKGKLPWEDDDCVIRGEASGKVTAKDTDDAKRILEHYPWRAKVCEYMDDPDVIEVDPLPVATNVDGTDEDLWLEIDDTGVLIDEYDDEDSAWDEYRSSYD